VCVPYPDGPIWEPSEPSRRTLFLNRKTEALAKYALDTGYDFVFKCDDDTYVNVERLLASGFESHDYVGNMDEHWTPTLGKYQWAQGGAGYWLSRQAMEIVATSGLHLARAEDFAVGQILAAHGVRPAHDARYIPSVTEEQLASGLLPDDFITLHKIDPAWMRKLHAPLTD
jgi:fringe-like protein